MANYGNRIQPPSIVQPGDLSENLREEIFGDTAEEGGPPAEEDDEVPCPIHPTTEEIESWIQSTYRKLTNLSTKIPPEVGESVLWRNVKTGKHGQPSTKVEYFHGKVKAVHVEDNEMYIYID